MASLGPNEFTLPDLVPWGAIERREHRLKIWHIAWRHLAITCTNTDMSSTIRICMFLVDISFKIRHFNSSKCTSSPNAVMSSFPSHSTLSVFWHSCVLTHCDLVHRFGSTPAQGMACCLTASSHYLKECRLIIIGDRWHWPKANLLKVWNREITLNYIYKIPSTSPWGQWVNKQPGEDGVANIVGEINRLGIMSQRKQP